MNNVSQPLHMRYAHMLLLNFFNVFLEAIT